MSKWIIDVNTILPIGIKTSNTGDNTFTIDALENVPNNLNIYIHDSVNETYHDIRQADFTINLTAGEYLNRFELVFSNPDALSIEEVIISDINTYYSNNLESIVIHNPKLKTIKSLSLYNIVGQKIIDFNDIKNEDYIELKTDKLSSGTYIIKLNTDEGEVSKKVLID